jgi:YidC/Oxa1 family membrane protein insertase
MAKMRKLQPKMEAIKERFSDDRQKLSQAMIELYKTEKVNPAGGCLPILIQIPVFFALYMVLIESVELRLAPWIGWIKDLAVPDPFYILPIIMGITMFVQQKLSPPPPDPTQAKIMMFLPIVFTILFANFPAGLVLYWTVNNALSILQQWYIMRSVESNNGKARINKKATA